MSLNRSMQYGNLHNLERFFNLGIVFKSYYVVWKLIQMTENKNITQGLNRTMQYGNQIYSSMLPRFSIRLNRTMQYGNFPSRPLFLRLAPV